MSLQELINTPVNSGLGTNLHDGANIINAGLAALDAVTITANNAATNATNAANATTALTTTVSSQGTAIANLQTAVGGTGSFINPAAYGTVDPTGTNDMTAIFQAAINAGIAQKLPVHIPSGVFLIAGTLFMYRTGSGGSYGGNGLYDSCALIGNGGDYDYYGGSSAPYNPYNYSAFTAFLSTSLSNPVICIDSARGFRLQNITFFGPNSGPGAQVYPNDTQSNYAGACRVAQCSPHCAVAIDSLNCAVPADGSLTGALNTGGVNGYPGLTSYYYGSTVNASSGGIIADCRFMRYVVGVAHNPSGVDHQTDNIKYDRCYFKQCDTGVCIGSNQNKIVTLNDCTGFQVRQLIDCQNYGAIGALNQGFPPALIRPYVQAAYRVFTCPSSYGALHIDQLYCEGVATLGLFGVQGTSRRSPCVITGGTFCIATTGYQTGFVTSPLFFETESPVTITGVDFYYSNGAPTNGTLNIAAWGSPLNFRGCGFQGSNTHYQFPFLGLASVYNSTSVNFDDCWINTGLATFPYSDNQKRLVSAGGYTNRLIAGPQMRRVSYSGNEYLYTPPSNYYGVSGCSAWSISGTTLTFTTSNPQYLQVNDILAWTLIPALNSSLRPFNACWLVTGISGTTITCSSMFDVTKYDTVANYNANGSGNTMYVAIVPWAPLTSLLATFSSGSTSLTMSTSQVLQNGDWIQGAGLPSGTRIVSGANSVSGGSGGTTTITINQATSSAQTNTPLYNGRLYVPTLTAAY